MKVVLGNCIVAGVPHYQTPDDLKQLDPIDEVTLHREPENLYDLNAVRVEVAGVKIGYLPRQVASWVSRLLDLQFKMEATLFEVLPHTRLVTIVLELYAEPEK